MSSKTDYGQVCWSYSGLYLSSYYSFKVFTNTIQQEPKAITNKFSFDENIDSVFTKGTYAHILDFL